MIRSLRTPMVWVVLATVSIVGCSPEPGPASSTSAASGKTGDDTVAYLDGNPIRLAEVEDEARGVLRRLEQQRYDALKGALERMVDERLLEAEAARRGVDVEELHRSEIDEKVIAPSDEELRAEWKAKGAQMARGRTFEQVRHFIVADLTRPRTEARRQAFLAELREKGGYRDLLEPPRYEVPIPEGELSLGPEDAAVTVVEFSDYECPYCRQAHDNVERLLEDYGDRIRFVYRDYPLDMHPRARPAARAARCADEQGKYLEYHRNLMTLDGTLGANDLLRRAGETGLDIEAFRECLDSERHEAAVDRGFRDANELGVRGTPTFFVNGLSLYGTLTYEDFRAVVEQELARASSNRGG